MKTKKRIQCVTVESDGRTKEGVELPKNPCGTTVAHSLLSGNDEIYYVWLFAYPSSNLLLR